MAGKHCSTDVYPVIWVFEVLACSKKLNTSDLIDLVRWTMKLSDDIGESSKELVSLRILETLFDQGDENKNKSVTCEKIAFDLSNSFKEVLHHILQEISPSNLKLGDLEMLKQDVQPSIACKRNGLPMTTLQKLKDAILEGNNYTFTSLKERSGLVVRSEGDDGVLGDGVDTNGAVQKLEERRKDTHILSCTQNSSPNTTRNCANELQENHIDRNLLPCKRNRTDLMAENLERETHCGQIVQGTSYVPYAESSKKPKQDIHVTSHAAAEKLIVSTRDGELANSSGRVAQHIDREGHNLDNDSEIGGMVEHPGCPHDASNQSPDKNFKQSINITEHSTVLKSTTSAGDGLSANSSATIEQNDREKHDLEKKSERGGKDVKRTGCTDDGGNQFAALEMLMRCTVVDAGDHDSQVQNPTDDNVDVNRPGELQGKTKYADKANSGMKVFAEKDNRVTETINPSSCNLQGNTSTGAEANGVADHNQDSETACDSDWDNEERNNIELKKSAFLSFQCTYSQEMFQTQPNLCIKCNSGGKLLSCSSSSCPLSFHERCLGSPAIFDGDGTFYCPSCVYSRVMSEYREVNMKMSLARKYFTSLFGSNVEQSHVRGSDEMNENNKSNTDRDSSNEVDHSHLGPTVEGKLQNEPSTSRAGNFGHCGEVAAEELNKSEKGNLALEGREQECRSPIQPGELQVEIPSGPHCQAIPESSEEDDKKSPASANSSGSRRAELHTYTAVPQRRRRRKLWTNVEEDKLKEGVQKFSSDDDSIIPWKAILEFGADVFEKGRTAVDLKDKWRNMCKAASKSR